MVIRPTITGDDGAMDSEKELIELTLVRKCQHQAAANSFIKRETRSLTPAPKPIQC